MNTRLMDQACRELAELPGVMNLRVGKNIEASPLSYSIGLVMDFQDEPLLKLTEYTLTTSAL